MLPRRVGAQGRHLKRISTSRSTYRRNTGHCAFPSTMMAIFRPCKFCRCRMFLSGVTSSSKPAASAAFNNSPLNKSVPSRLFRFRDGVAFKKADQRRGRSVVKEYTHQRSGRAVAQWAAHPDSAPRIPAPLRPVPASRQTTP